MRTMSSPLQYKKFSTFHTTVTYSNVKLSILVYMTKETGQNYVNKITFSSADIINIILDALGLNREQISTYKN